MTAQNFCYWLQGYFEVTGTDELSPEQVAMVKRHLSLVFENVTEVAYSPAYSRRLERIASMFEKAEPTPSRAADRRRPGRSKC